jgi:hypothetical protein
MILISKLFQEKIYLNLKSLIWFDFRFLAWLKCVLPLEIMLLAFKDVFKRKQSWKLVF